MDSYYVNNNSQPSGDHEVHKSTCSWLDKVVSKKYLGMFETCRGAVTEAKKTYNTANGCYYCSNSCHTT